MSFEQFIPEDYTPNARTSAELYAQAMEELALPAPSVRMKDEFSKFDHMTGGFRPREFSILCGATGSGKTTLLSNLSAAMLKQKIPHYVASVETGATDFLKRIISVLENRDYNHGEAIDIEALKKVHVLHGGTLASDLLHLSLYDNRFSVEELMAEIAWHVKNKGIKVAMIDNLNFFLEITSAQQSVVEMDRVIHELIMFCKKIDVHVIMVMHPKKTEHGRVESEFDIKGSSTAVQEAHNVFLWNRIHPDLIKAGRAGPMDRELKIAKMRRRGKFVGNYLIFKCGNGVSYAEGDIV